MRICKWGFLLTLVIISFVCSCIPVTASSPVHVYPEGEWDETGIFVLRVSLDLQGAGLCGLELDITYDADILSLSSCERGGALSDLGFDCSLEEGRIRLLFWGTKNSQNGGRLATICFVAAKDSGECELSLSLPTRTSAVYFENDRILAANISLSGIRVSLSDFLQAGQKLPPPEISTSVGGDALDGPTELLTELPTELPAESSSESSTETPAGTDVPDGPLVVKRISFGLACATSGMSLFAIIPLFFPDIFRKGYF